MYFNYEVLKVWFVQMVVRNPNLLKTLVPDQYRQPIIDQTKQEYYSERLKHLGSLTPTALLSELAAKSFSPQDYWLYLHALTTFGKDLGPTVIVCLEIVDQVTRWGGRPFLDGKTETVKDHLNGIIDQYQTFKREYPTLSADILDWEVAFQILSHDLGEAFGADIERSHPKYNWLVKIFEKVEIAALDAISKDYLPPNFQETFLALTKHFREFSQTPLSEQSPSTGLVILLDSVDGNTKSLTNFTGLRLSSNSALTTQKKQALTKIQLRSCARMMQEASEFWAAWLYQASQNNYPIDRINTAKRELVEFLHKQLDKYTEAGYASIVTEIYSTFTDFLAQLEPSNNLTEYRPQEHLDQVAGD